MTTIYSTLRRCAAVAVLLLAAACAPFSLVPATSNDVANFRVDADITWSKVNQLRVQSDAPIAYWTADGPNLNGILFIGGVKDGQTLIKKANDTDKNQAVYRSGMTATEIVEIWESAMSKLSDSTITKGGNIQPATFAGTTGFSFELQYVNKDEVDRSGLGYAAVKDGKLYLIFFAGTKLHHYPVRLASAKRIMESARITG